MRELKRNIRRRIAAEKRRVEKRLAKAVRVNHGGPVMDAHDLGTKDGQAFKKAARAWLMELSNG